MTNSQLLFAACKEGPSCEVFFSSSELTDFFLRLEHMRIPYHIKSTIEGPDDLDIGPELELPLQESKDADVNAIRPAVPGLEDVGLDAREANPQHLSSEGCAGWRAHAAAQMRLEGRYSKSTIATWL